MGVTMKTMIHVASTSPLFVKNKILVTTTSLVEDQK
jgi:hypothetical protein